MLTRKRTFADLTIEERKVVSRGVVQEWTAMARLVQVRAIQARMSFYRA